MAIQFATWGATISGGFLRSTIEQETRWDFDYNLQLTTLADRLGFYAMLFPTRYVGRIGGNEEESGQLDPLTTVAALARATSRLHLISAVLPAFVPPTLLAKVGATIDRISNGRWHPNIVSGWFKEEQEAYGISWVEHSQRYQRSSEYIEVLKGLWQKESFTYEGDFYKISEGKLRPLPVQSPYPAIFQGGNSQEAREMAGRLSDWYFMNGAPVEELKEQIEDVQRIAKSHGRTLRFAVNAYVIARPTEKEARAEYEEIVAKANVEVIEEFRKRAQEAKGMWSHSNSLSDYVANNEGFRTGLIGSYDQVAAKIRELEEAGIDLVLLTFRYPLEEIVPFHEKVQIQLQTIKNKAV